MYTARALRRLKPDLVPDELITRVLDAAIRAPSGGNAQNWIFIVVRDEAQRRRLCAVYRKASVRSLKFMPPAVARRICRTSSTGALWLAGNTFGSTSLKHPFCSCPA